MSPSLVDTALELAESGYLVLPCIAGSKTPLVPNGCHDATRDARQIEAWWRRWPEANVAVHCAGVVVVDIDGECNTWPVNPEWKLDLAATPVCRTPRGGTHHWFRDEHGVYANSVKRMAAGVDTRAEGGYVVVPPSLFAGKQYRWVPGSELDRIDQLTEPPGWLMGILPRKGESSTRSFGSNGEGGADSGGETIPEGRRNDALARLGGAMRRVGMTREEIFTALEQVNLDRCSPPVEASEVASIAASVARYDPDEVSKAVVYGTGIDTLEPPAAAAAAAAAGAEEEDRIPDPGALPPDLIHEVPGFVSEVMDLTLQTAPYPNPVLSFCGAIALQAFLAGRKVRDRGNVRTNLFIMGLAESGAGKEWPRKVNYKIAQAAGMIDSVGERFASGEGVQDALFLSPSMLFQTDEIDILFQSINKAHDARHENILAQLLMLFSSSDSIFPMRRRSGKDAPSDFINQPNLVIFGTGIPNHYYSALSERFLTNGLMSRILAFEAKRGKGQDAKDIQPSARILETAAWWSKFNPGHGNLSSFNPVPAVVPSSSQATQSLHNIRSEAEEEYTRAEEGRSSVSAALWSRVPEQTAKLALIYALSQSYEAPEVSEAAVSWAGRLVVHQTRRMLYQSSLNVAVSPHHAECLKVLRAIKEAPNGLASRSLLMRRTKMDCRTLSSSLDSLISQGSIKPAPQSDSDKKRGRPASSFQTAS